MRRAGGRSAQLFSLGVWSRSFCLSRDAAAAEAKKGRKEGRSSRRAGKARRPRARSAGRCGRATLPPEPERTAPSVERGRSHGTRAAAAAPAGPAGPRAAVRARGPAGDPRGPTRTPGRPPGRARPRRLGDRPGGALQRRHEPQDGQCAADRAHAAAQAARLLLQAARAQVPLATGSGAAGARGRVGCGAGVCFPGVGGRGGLHNARASAPHLGSGREGEGRGGWEEEGVRRLVWDPSRGRQPASPARASSVSVEPRLLSPCLPELVRGGG